MEWFALFHRPGPALAEDESIFEHPAMRDHGAFLGRMQERGLLIAAGPLPDEPGAGMTILRTDGTVDVAALATTDDLSVVGGYLTVEIRPWDVRFSTVD